MKTKLKKVRLLLGEIIEFSDEERTLKGELFWLDAKDQTGMVETDDDEYELSFDDILEFQS